MIKRYSNFINESLIEGELPHDSELTFIESAFEEFDIRVRIGNSYHDSEGGLIHEQDKNYIAKNNVYITKYVFINGDDITDEKVKIEFNRVVRKLEYDGYKVLVHEGKIGSGELNYIRLCIYPKNI